MFISYFYQDISAYRTELEVCKVVIKFKFVHGSKKFNNFISKLKSHHSFCSSCVMNHKNRSFQIIQTCLSLWRLDTAKFQPYLDGGGGVEHVLQTEVAAAVQVVFAEVLDELEVVEAISQRHVLLHGDI